MTVENDEPSLTDMNLNELRAGLLADLERIFPEYRFLPSKRLKVISERTTRPDLAGPGVLGVSSAQDD